MANIIEITDFNSPQLDIYARMSEGQLLNRHEPEKGIFIAESPKVIQRAVNAGYEPISFLVEHRDLEGAAKEILAQFPETPVYTAEYDVLVKLTGFALTRGMLCAMKRRQLPSVEEICQNACIPAYRYEWKGHCPTQIWHQDILHVTRLHSS